VREERERRKQGKERDLEGKGKRQIKKKENRNVGEE